MRPTKALLRLEAVAELLDVSRKQVYNLVHDGQLEAIQVGRKLRVHPDTVEKFLNTHRKATPAKAQLRPMTQKVRPSKDWSRYPGAETFVK